jgi:alkaline phosphatase
MDERRTAGRIGVWQRSRFFAATVVLLVLVAGCAAPGLGRYLAGGEALRTRNVIFVNGDGMGPAHVEAARRALAGSGGLELDQLEVRGRNLTNSPDDRDGPVTDSAAAATAWSTGSHTSNGAVGTDANGRPLSTFGREAKAAGKGTGLVTTAEVTDASPAAFYSSATDRELTERIARQYIDGGGPDVILGGGRSGWKSGDLLGSARTAGYGYADSAATLTSGTDAKLLGLFADEELWKAEGTPPPSLAMLTTAALDRLSTGTDGFFLFVEEEGIDEASHANDGEAMLAAMRSLDEAVGAARRFVAANPETLLIVTGDHETGGLSIDGGSGLRWRTGDHTETPTPVFATGPGSDQLTGDWPNTHMHDVLTSTLLSP